MPPQESEPDGHYGRWKMEDCKVWGSARCRHAVSGSLSKQIGASEAEDSVVIRLRATTARQVDRRYRNLNRPESPSFLRVSSSQNTTGLSCFLANHSLEI